MILLKTKILLFKLAIKKSTWFFVFIGCIFLLYGHAIKNKNKQITDIKARIDTMRIEKHSLLKEQENLVLKINSQSDPAWIERVLMQQLGVVPKGKTKVCFTKE
jgi:hypothetical protein